MSVVKFGRGELGPSSILLGSGLVLVWRLRLWGRNQGHRAVVIAPNRFVPAEQPAFAIVPRRVSARPPMRKKHRQEIVSNSVIHGGVCTGGIIFELSDEWWKDGARHNSGRVVG